ncbi:ABC transporter ATP-binding protein [Rhodococcus opacus]|uniref:ABC transporter ATP-binding protein n=1 Tax=Rhodococcus opacus TaxID=37919 RepID=UPI003AAC1DFA
MTYALEVAGLDKTFGGATVLDQIAFAVAAGSTTAIVGPSGCGKTTLLRLIAGFVEAGRRHHRTGRPGRRGGGGWTPAHRRSVGYVAQDGALFPHATVGANVGFGLPRRARTAPRIAELLEMVSLDPSYAARRPDQLSGGQQQRVALARALAREPELMLLDEPFSALDAGLRANTRRIVADVLAKAAITTILVTHDQPEALSFADRVAVMSTGRLAQIGTPPRNLFHPHRRPHRGIIGDAVVLSAHVEGSRARCALGDVAVASNGVHGNARVMVRPETDRGDHGRRRRNRDGRRRRIPRVGNAARIRLDNGGRRRLRTGHRPPLRRHRPSPRATASASASSAGAWPTKPEPIRPISRAVTLVPFDARNTAAAPNDLSRTCYPRVP